MDVREKLVELLNDCQAKGSWLYGIDCKTGEVGGHEMSSVDIANYLTENCVTVQEWKPISEPPKEKGTYLVCTDNGGVLLGHWYGTAWNAGGGAKKHLAYWMEKPQPPKGE